MSAYLWDALTVATPFLVAAVGVSILVALHDLIAWIVRRWRA